MQHNGLPVAGYRPQTDEKIALVNKNKEWEEFLLRRLDGLKDELVCPIDQRWLAIGRSHIEQGFMAINRAIFQPSRVDLVAEFTGAVTPNAA